MTTYLGSSRALCAVCGDTQVLSAEAVVASAELATFAAAHSTHERFLIDVVIQPYPASKAG